MNQDCIRDILIYVYENINYKKEALELEELVENLQYEEAEIVYYIRDMHRQGLFINVFYSDDTVEAVFGLTEKGQSMVSVLKNDTTWKKVKKEMVKVGISTLPTLISIALKMAMPH